MDNDVLYKITVQKSFYIEAPDDALEYEVIEQAVNYFNNNLTEEFLIVPSDVVLVQYYDTNYTNE